MKTKLFFLLFFTAFLFAQCSVEKRLYTKGWSVEWLHHYKSPPSEEEQPVLSTTGSEKYPVQSVTAEMTDLCPREILTTSAAEIRQPEIAVTQLLEETPASESPKTVEEDSLTEALEKIILKEQQNTSAKQSNDRSDDDGGKGVLIAMAAVLVVLAILGIFLFGSILGIGGGFADIALIGILSVLIAVAVIGLIVAAFSAKAISDESKTAPEAPKEKKKEKTPEEAAQLKRKGAIVMGIFVAAIVGVLVALKLS